MITEEYWKERRKFEKSRIFNLSQKWKERVHVILYTIVAVKNKLDGYHITIIGDKRSHAKGAKIFAVSHICKQDVEIASEAIKDHYHLLTNDFENINGTLEGEFLRWNGVVYFKKDDKADRRTVKPRLKQILESGGNVMWFPEGEWNITPHLLVNPLFPGITDVAKDSGASIVPIVMEQYGNEFIVNIGAEFQVDDNPEVDSKVWLIRLRDQMASLKWEIFEKVPMWKRAEIPEGYWEKEVAERMAEWPSITMQDFLDEVYKDKNIVTPEEAFGPIRALKVWGNEVKY